METFNSWTEASMAAFGNIWIKIIGFIPEMLGALLILIVGWLISKVLGRITVKILDAVKLDAISEKFGLRKLLDDMGMKFRISDLIGRIVKWFFIIVTLIAMANVLKISQVSSFLERVAFYIPNVIAAIFILVLGVLMGGFLASVIRGPLVASGISERASLSLSNLAKWSVFVFALMAAIVQLGVAEDLIRILFMGLVVMFALAGGLAFGLGGREKAAKILDAMEAKWSK